MGKKPAAMLAIKRSAGVAPEVNLRECIICKPLSRANKAAQSGFETQRRHQWKSKTWVSVALQKRVMSSKFFLKKKNIIIFCHFVPLGTIMEMCTVQGKDGIHATRSLGRGNIRSWVHATVRFWGYGGQETHRIECTQIKFTPHNV